MKRSIQLDFRHYDIKKMQGLEGFYRLRDSKYRILFSIECSKKNETIPLRYPELDSGSTVQWVFKAWIPGQARNDGSFSDLSIDDETVTIEVIKAESRGDVYK